MPKSYWLLYNISSNIKCFPYSLSLVTTQRDQNYISKVPLTINQSFYYLLKMYYNKTID